MAQKLSDLLLPKGQPLGKWTMPGVLFLCVCKRKLLVRVFKMGYELPRTTKGIPSSTRFNRCNSHRDPWSARITAPHPTSFLVGFITRKDRATTDNTTLGVRELHSWSVADRATCPSKCALPVSWTQGHTAFPSLAAGRTRDQALAPCIKRKGTTSTSRIHEKIPGPGICSRPLSLTRMTKVSEPLVAMC